MAEGTAVAAGRITGVHLGGRCRMAILHRRATSARGLRPGWWATAA